MGVLFWYNILIIAGMLVSIPYFFFAQKEYRKKHLIIFLVLLGTSITEVMTRDLQLSKINNSLVINIGYITISISLLFVFFYFILNQNKLIIFLSGFYITWIIINSIFFQPIASTFQNYSWALSSFIIIGMCFYYFYEVLTKDKYLNQSLISIPDFWIVSFVLFFYSCSFLYFVSFNFFYDKIDITFYRQLNFLIKILGSSMYMVMGLAFYAPLVFKNKNISGTSIS